MGCLGYVDEPELLHVTAVVTVDEEFGSEDVVKHEELLLKQTTGFGALVGENVLAPHSQELPSFELLEEGKLLDVVEGVALDQPVPKGNELLRSLFKVKGDAFGRQRVVALLGSVVVLGDLEIVGVALKAWIEIDEN